MEMENNMKENWKQEMWERSRDRIAEIYQRVSSIDIEAFLKTSIIGIVGKDIIEHARRKTSVVRNAGKNMLYQARQKYDSKGLEKHLKLRKFVAGIRSGRLGYLLLVLAALCTLTVPLMFQSTYIPQEDWELERAMAIQFHQGRGVDETFNRKMKLAQEKNLIYEEGKKSSEISHRWNSGQVGREVSGGHDAYILDSEVNIFAGKNERQHKVISTKPATRGRNRSKRYNIIEEVIKRALEKSTAGFDEKETEQDIKLDSHAVVLSEKTMSLSDTQESLNMTPLRANSTVDSEGLSNGFSEAFNEVLKLASEANKTAGKHSVHLQEEASVTESLPTHKPAELDVQVREVVDRASQKLSEAEDEPSGKGTIASFGLYSEENKENVSVGEGMEASHNTPQTKPMFAKNVEEGKSELLKSNSMEDKDKHQTNILSGNEGNTLIQTQTSTASRDSDVVMANVGKVKSMDLSTENVDNSNELKIIQGRDPEVTVVESSREAGNSLENSSESIVNATETNNNFTSMKDEDDIKVVGVMDGEKLDDDAAEEQELQAEVRQENSDEWPQESALISSLRLRATSGTLRVGLLNMEATDFLRWQFLAGERPIIIPFERVNEAVDWNQLYPEWIDEEETYGAPICPAIPMPKISPEVQLDVVIARVPCASSALQEGWKQPASLQVLLGAASLAVNAGNGSIYVLILSECRPLVNLFSCGELLEHRDQGWLYQVNVEQLKKRTSMSVGSCQLSIPLRGQDTSLDTGASNLHKEAYVTILHSGADYVCGAIVTAHSIRKTGSTKDLVILVDSSISPEQRQALGEAGWEITDYNKVVYVEADVLVLRNLDHLFSMPEISASGSTKTLFNSGVMVVEPSNCTFQLLMDEMEKIISETGGDWDFFNRIFPWWHRIPKHMNYLKYFWTRSRTSEVDSSNRLFSAEPPQLYAIHYWGYKPWQCFRDYDCNWNSNNHFASDEAHARWFKVYDELPENLQKFCSLSTGTKAYLEHNRRVAEAAALEDKHWAITITDPRLNVCLENHCDWNALLSYWDKTVNSSSSVLA
uniref:Uncharacterized protein n=1 Tax=Physcomitrium patens TaxID=3218 RepID=A0A2K1KW49_PHYPA|nr:hypothetical protein PHYPA_004998 [Physcomitrium patens]